MTKLPAMHASLDSVIDPAERDEVILRMLEEERLRIAADLHDGIGQTLSAMQLAVGGLRELLEDRFTDVEDAIFGYLTARISDAMDDVRRICIDQRPAQLDDQGVINAISGLCRELCQGLNHLDVNLTVRAYESDIPLPVKVAAFRILQEACSNACKHARAAHLSVLLEADAEGIRLTVADDGVGFTAGPVRQSKSGFGLGSMRRRATMTGGSLSVRSQPGQGTQVVAAWQVEESADPASIGGTAA
jgi:two-component system NarL family sensor kinase